MLVLQWSTIEYQSLEFMQWKTEYLEKLNSIIELQPYKSATQQMLNSSNTARPIMILTLQLQTLVCYIEKMWIKRGFTLLHKWVKKHKFRIFEMLPAKPNSIVFG